MVSSLITYQVGEKVATVCACTEYTLTLLLIARTKFSDFSNQSHYH